MSAKEIQILESLKGRHVELKLKAGSCSGFITRVDVENRALVLEGVTCENKFNHQGTLLFFGHEIVKIKFIGEESSNSGNIAETSEKEPNVTTLPTLKQTACDDEEKEEFINFEVIDEFNQRFGTAVMNIKQESVVGVGADGIENFKNGRFSWLQIATKTKVYLFDILQLGARAFKNGLFAILKNEKILKVIHDCRVISGCLRVHFGVELVNVFDTQVADVMCFRLETGGLLPDRGSTLEEVIRLHLQVSPSKLSRLQEKAQYATKENDLWYKRPCPVPLLKMMAASVVDLCPLRLVLLKGLMTDYMTVVGSLLKSSSDDSEDLRHIDSESIVELPNELRQLNTEYWRRRRQATRRYPVVAKNFLVRFNPIPESAPRGDHTQSAITVSDSKSGEQDEYEDNEPSNSLPFSEENELEEEDVGSYSSSSDLSRSFRSFRHM